MQEKLEKIELFLYVLRFVGICQCKFSEKPWQDKLAQGTYVHALARAGAQWIKNINKEVAFELSQFHEIFYKIKVTLQYIFEIVRL